MPGPEASAATAATAPVGVFTVTISAGTGTGSALSTVSLPLHANAGLAGAMTGRITGVTASTITNAAAGWTAGELSSTATPCLLQITSGDACGRTFMVSSVTANTSGTLTIASEETSLVNLATLGIATGSGSGDTYRILAAETIASIFGSPAETGVLGGTGALAADNVYVFVGGVWLRYYYNTSYGSWRRVGPNTNADNVVIRPDTIVLYSRLAASAITLRLVGEVPSVSRQALVRASGVTALANNWPVSFTLDTFALDGVGNWNSSSTVTKADKVRVLVNGAWLSYYHDGFLWRRVGPNTKAGSLEIPAGSGVLVDKAAASTSPQVFSQNVPYDLSP